VPRKPPAIISVSPCAALGTVVQPAWQAAGAVCCVALQDTADTILLSTFYQASVSERAEMELGVALWHTCLEDLHREVSCTGWSGLSARPRIHTHRAPLHLCTHSHALIHTQHERAHPYSYSPHTRPPPNPHIPRPCDWLRACRARAHVLIHSCTLHRCSHARTTQCMVGKVDMTAWASSVKRRSDFNDWAVKTIKARRGIDLSQRPECVT
jgi:hypothetical protein